MDVYLSIPSINKILQICGMTQISIDPQNKEPPYKERRWRNWSLAVICFVICNGVFTLIVFYNWVENPVLQTLYYVQKVLILILQMTLFIDGFLKSDRIHSIYCKMQNIDVALAKILPTDEADVRRIRRKIILRSWGFLAVHVSSTIVYFASLAVNEDDHVYFLPSADYYICLACVCLKCYHTFIIIYLSKVQFDRFNCCLASLQQLNQISSTAENFRKLEIMQGIYDDLYDLVQMICDFVGIMTIINIPNDIFNIIVDFSWLIWEINDFGIFALQLESIISWSSNISIAIPNAVNYLTLAALCQETIDSSSKVRLRLHEVFIDINNPEHSSLVEVFSLQLIHKPIVFSFFGVFEINLGAVSRLLMSFVTYLVVLLDITGFKYEYKI